MERHLAMWVADCCCRWLLSAVDHEAKLDSPVRVGVSSESFSSAKLVAESILTVRGASNREARLLCDM